MHLSTYLTFVLACVALILLPGPSQALVMTRTLSEGTRAGLQTAVGLNVGTLGHALAAALGLSTVLATSALAFSVVKYVGAAYLLYLGIRAWRTPAPAPAAVAAAPMPSSSASFAQAVAAGLLNPKVALFFLAFLPQFVDPARGAVFAQFLLLGATMAVLDTVYESVLVLLVARARARWTAGPGATRWRERVTGTVLVGLALRLALQER